MGEGLTLWSVRAAVVCYAVSLVLRTPAAFDRRRLARARLAWTVGYIAFLGHMAAAFHFYHHWSHDAAYIETARQTAEVAGLDWGGGVYANYAFALIWGLDVLWWWRGLERYERRSSWVEWSIQGYLAFIIFNATLVFGKGFARWLGTAVTLAIVVWLNARLRRNRESVRESADSPTLPF